MYLPKTRVHHLNSVANENPIITKQTYLDTVKLKYIVLLLSQFNRYLQQQQQTDCVHNRMRLI